MDTATPINIDERDLLNMLRHAFLIGFNYGIQAERKHDYNIEADERDKVLQLDLIDDFKEHGWMGYNDDNGSHTCAGFCKEKDADT